AGHERQLIRLDSKRHGLLRRLLPVQGEHDAVVVQGEVPARGEQGVFQARGAVRDGLCQREEDVLLRARRGGGGGGTGRERGRGRGRRQGRRGRRRGEAVEPVGGAVL